MNHEVQIRSKSKYEDQFGLNICFLVDYHSRSFNENIEYIDEFLEEEEEVYNLMHESGGHKKEQGRSGFLRIDATDMRPKCPSLI